jgi:hypothetical protein
MYVSFSSLFLFVFIFLSPRAGPFAIQISMRIGERHLKISKEKFRHKKSLRMYPIVRPLPCLLQQTTTIVMYLHLPYILVPITPPLLLHTPGDLHPRLTPLQIRTQFFSSKKLVNLNLV